MLKLGSLFDGSGGFPLAGILNGIEPVWASEVEPYPIAVTRSRFPKMIHLGDVSQIRGGAIPPVDVITFGSPCQDMSTAGKRAGMQHAGKGDDQTTRSGLFYEAVRIIREMREATDGRNPTFAVWENVPGAFSSNNGEDFRCVLEELEKISGGGLRIPRPSDGGWPNAGEIVADGYSIAWRVLDAQYWGVPQRRRRIYLVADFRGQRAGKILFERDGLSRHFTACEEAREESAEDAGGCASGSSGDGVVSIHDKATRCKGGGLSRRDDGSANGLCVRDDGIMYALDTACRHAVAFIGGQGSKAGGIGCAVEVSPTLNAHSGGGNQMGVVYPAIARTLTAEADSSPCIDRGQNILVYPNVFHTLSAQNARCVESAQQPNCVCYTQKKFGVFEEAVGTITSDPRVSKSSGNIICMSNGQANAEIISDLSPTLTCSHEHAIICARERCGCEGGGKGMLCQTEASNALKTQNDQIITICEKRNRSYIVRRLTPTECARLQGFPDGWGRPATLQCMSDEEAAFWESVRRTHAQINQKRYVPAKGRDALVKWYNGLHTDSAEYKMWGNGIALPCALFVLEGIAKAITGRKDHESLCDG